MDERAMAQAAAAGDQAAFGALVGQYRAYIYAIAWRIALDRDDALDITQSVYLRLVEKIGSFDGRGTFKAWLATITAREAIDHLRRKPAREQAMEPELLEAAAASLNGGAGGAMGGDRGGPDVRERLDAAERRRRVGAAMTAISPQQRAILTLRLNEEIGPAAIAVRLGVPASQVRSQYRRAILKLREMMTKDGLT